ncbi:hypothetical protein NPIL_425901 [Nephila pilipes]|uniref:Uncharacterized protein n=1 Tax=Nephila pilipes TaxID=299642 RepID=A0A8X6P018_NEPPI|nr:hypothetical protein NPIL_425901 [Nephila pilipes]
MVQECLESTSPYSGHSTLRSGKSFHHLQKHGSNVVLCQNKPYNNESVLGCAFVPYKYTERRRKNFLSGHDRKADRSRHGQAHVLVTEATETINFLFKTN